MNVALAPRPAAVDAELAEGGIIRVWLAILLEIIEFAVEHLIPVDWIWWPYLWRVIDADHLWRVVPWSAVS